MATATTGIIKNMAVPWLLLDLAAGKQTGTVIFGFVKSVKKVYLSEGEIVFAASNQVEDRLGECMIRINAITPEQRDSSLEVSLATGKKLGGVLVEKGLITPKQLVEGVRFQIKQITSSVFKWYDGCYIFDDGPLPDIIPVRLGTCNLIIDASRDAGWDIVRKSFPSIRSVFRRKNGPGPLPPNVSLNTDEKTVLTLLDGTGNIADICSSSGLGDFNTLKALYVLCALRVVEPREAA